MAAAWQFQMLYQISQLAAGAAVTACRPPLSYSALCCEHVANCRTPLKRCRRCIHPGSAEVSLHCASSAMHKLLESNLLIAAIATSLQTTSKTWRSSRPSLSSQPMVASGKIWTSMGWSPPSLPLALP